ncbi:unnamed protein product, partial [Iphiclides podalirius]
MLAERGGGVSPMGPISQSRHAALGMWGAHDIAASAVLSTTERSNCHGLTNTGPTMGIRSPFVIDAQWPIEARYLHEYAIAPVAFGYVY